MSSVIGLGTQSAATKPSTGWSDPLGLYGADAPKIGGDVTIEPAKIEAPKASFLSKLADRDREDLIRTVIAEAAAEGEEGMAAVASVIKNRSGIRGKSPADIVREPAQFTGYEAPGADVAKSFNDPEMRAKAERIIDGVFSGEIPDLTGGADHYHADYVSPDWAGKMPKTAQVGRHLFYNSQPNRTAATEEPKAGSLPSYSELAEEKARAKAEEPFDALMAGQGHEAKGRGLADLLPDDQFEQDPKAAENFDTLLSKLQPGKPQSYITDMQPRLRTGLTAMFEAAPDFVKEGLDLLSGARSPERQAEIIAENAGKYGFDRGAWVADVEKLGPVEAGRKWRPEFRKLGLTKNIGMPGGSKHQTGDAGDLGWKGGAFSRAPKEVREWVHQNAGSFDLTFPMAHEPWHIEHKDARNGQPAPAREKAGTVSGNSAPQLEAGKGFEASDPFGLYGDTENPIAATVAKSAAAKQAVLDERAAVAEADAWEAETGRVNANAEDLAATDPSRYELVDESAVDAWRKTWDEENRSSGRVGDLVRNIGIGAAQTSQSISNLNRLLIDKLPGGEKINATLESIDRWLGGGKTSDEARQEGIDRQEATLTERTQEALRKKVINEDGSLGDALTDPDWYLANIARSAPAMVATMGPTGMIARGAYGAAVAAGASTATAAARAATAATIAGGVSEGLLGGADAALSVKQAIEQMPREQLLETDAVKAMIAEGMTPDDALAAVSNDVQTQAMLFAGVATGMFGGMGDRALAKIIGEGVQGAITRRTASGAARGMVAEGVFEELPQSVGQQVAENIAMQTVDPDRKATEGVAEAAVTGVAIGGAMGGAIGGVSGAASRRGLTDDTREAAPQPQSNEQFVAVPPRDPAQPAPAGRPAAPSPEQSTAKGPISRAIEHAQRQVAERNIGAAPRPTVGATVRVDAEGLEPFTGVIEAYDGDEAVVIDHSTGEALQVPIATLSQAGAAPQAAEPSTDILPEVSADPALEPAAPIAAEIRTEVPESKEQVPATSRFPGAPEPGARIIVDDETIGRFAARVVSYENNGTEALVTNDKGDSYQVPVTSLHVSGKTPAQVEAEALKRDPPIEREIGDAGPLSRKVGGGTVVLPDEKHADLYDFAREAFISKQLAGRGQITKDGEKALHGDTAKLRKLAADFGVSPEALATMADDYRFRVERAGKEAVARVGGKSGSALPVQMHPVNERRLKQWQAENKKAQGQDPSEGADDAHWWDVELTQAGRREILSAAGVKRPDNAMWQHLTPAIQKKLAVFRVDGPPAAEPAQERTFTTAKGSKYTLHADGTTTRDKAERADPGHEGDKGVKPKSDRTVFVATNAGALSAAGLSGMGSKGARVAIKDGKATLVTWNEKENRWGVAGEEARNIPISDTPAIGSYPLELWSKADDVPGYEAYSRMHAGNKITALDDGASAVPGQRTDDAAHEAATSPNNDRPEPTQAQKEAGNYKVGRINLGGLEISIENPAGSERKGVDKAGKPWSIEMKSHYGYIRGTIGRDKDHIDVFVKPGTDELTDASPVFVVDQQNETGAFDEHKVMLGFDSEEAARAAYLENYTAGWNGLGALTATTLGDFKAWTKDGDTTKRFAAKATETVEPSTAEPETSTAEAKPVKWFGTQQKAQAYINKNRLGSSHEIVEANRRFEIHEKAKDEQAEAEDAAAPIANGTAPEHVQRGVDDRELAQIVEEFRDAHSDMMDGEHPVSNVFQPPKKGEIVRLNDKAKVYHKEHGWMTPAEAKAKLEEWKAHARAQGTDPEIRSQNSDKVVLSLFDLSGEWSRPWEEAGYQVFRFDIQADPDMGDVNNFSTEFFNDWFGDFEGQDIYAILAACPCTDFASSGARHFAAKDKDGRTVASVKLVHQTLRTIEYFKPSVWALENPVGRIEELGGLPPWRLSFDPNHIGDPYTKKTLIWGRFNADLPVAPVEPTEGSKMHRMYGGKSQATKNARSVTPEGFAYGFFMANNAHDHAAMALANKFDRLDGKLIAQAIDAGVSVEDITSAVEDPYYFDLDDDAANAAIRDLLPKPPKPAKAEPEQSAAKVEPTPAPAPAAAPQPAAAGRPVTWLNDDFGNWSIPEGTRLRSVNGRELAPSPAFSIETPRKRTLSLQRQRKWLIDSAIKEAGRSPLEGNMLRVFERMQPDNLSRSDFDTLNDYLFGDPDGPTAANVMADQAPAPNAAAPTKTKTPAAAPKAKPQVSENTVFTADAAELARATLRKKLSQLNSGIDPEIMQAGITLAGYHIERGARTFAAYASAMLGDLGEAARPYLKSWYMGVKYDPRAMAFEGMSSAAEVDAIDVASIRTEPENEPTELDRSGSRALEGTPADPVSEPQEGRDAGRGVEGSSRADVPAGGRARTERVPAGRSVSDGEGGVSVPAGGRQRAEQSSLDFSADGERGQSRPAQPSDVDEGPFGPILRGYEGNWREAALELERRQTGDAIGALHHADVGPIDLVWGNAGTNASNGAGLAKLIAWHPEVLTDLQGFIGRLSVDKDRSTSRRIQLVDETGNAGVRLDFDGTAKTWLLTAYEAGKRRSERSSRRLTDLWADQTSPASPPVENIGDRLANVQSAATPAQNRPADHVIAAEDGIGEGGAKTKFRANVAAIEILRTLDAEKRPANRQEQTALSKWVGWGGLRSAFYREDGTVTKGWEKEAAELKALLTPEEYAAAESSTRNAHYTSPEIVAGIWDAVRRLGFKGGQILEPSVGVGNFLGLMPGDMRGTSRVTGVELDRITGGIAKNLYPSANIQAPLGFEKLTIPDNHFDLAIGNPPFGSERLYDKERRALNKFSIHNFFFAKSIDTLRPGGVLAMVVTNRFLDGNNEAARAYIAKKADLVGAIRLPNNAFLKNAGTEVTTDIIILRKREEGEAASSTAWTDVGEYRGKDGKSVPLNRYFIDNPDMMLGDFGAYGSMYGPDEPALVAREGEDVAKALAAATQKLPQDIMTRPGAPIAAETVTVAEGVRDVQVGSMFVAPDGSVHIRKPDSIGEAQSQPVEFASETAKERVAGMVRVRDAFARLRRAQIDDKATDAQVENLRKRLNTVYDAFTAKHGPINHDVNKRLFRDDPTWPQISALEQSYDKGITAASAKKTGEKARAPSATKAAIFTKRTQQPYKVPTAASSARDALALSLNLTGAIDLDLMSRLYSKGPEAIVEELGPLVYKTPAGAYEPADQYLSGNVKAKLAQAEEAAKDDPDFRRNVAALRDVIPADIEAVDIDVKPGAPWVPANHVEDFVTHITEREGTKAYYSKANAKWDLDIAGATPASETLWATDRARLSAVLTAAMNGQTITITNRYSDGKTEVDQPATEAANEKVERVKAEWGRWIWTDDARRDELARLYNDTFNTDVIRTFDGSHLTLPGKVGDDVISLRPHQKAFVWRTLQSGTTLADHTVGAGKTFAAITSAMEKRRIGQAKKPMFVVPNHLVGQWAADFIRLYPGAKVLAATKKDFEAENRKRLFARIATGDWDAVIVAHSSFGRIGINPEYEAAFIQEQLEELEESIKELRRNTGEKSRNVSQLTKWRDNMKAKLERLLDAGRKDDGLTFDELGVDALYVDEAHEFKNLAFSTSMTRVAGLGNPLGSQKAADLYMKSRFILERTGGKNLVFLTGTPISNTMAEMYTVQRYLDQDTLRAMGIAHFDAWARVFGEVVTDWELSPSGQYKLNSRFARFVNLPELMQRYLSFADVITNDDIKRQLAEIGKTLPLPKVKGGAPAIVVVERSPDQARYIGIPKVTDQGEQYPEGSLVYRAENLPKKAAKGADNMLKVMSDARKAALDMRLIDPSYGDYHSSKIHQAADDMVRLYKRWDEKKGTQLVFIDLSTPKKAKAAEEKRIRDLMAKAEQGDEAAQEKLDNMSPDEFMALESPFSVYDDLKDKLIERGIPESEIAFIHDANTDAQKEELFGKVRSGRIRFLFGSTAKMGAGTNVQNRLVALHHMDAPWRPSDLEQRDGRGIRQGNELYNEDPDGFEIEIRRYATKNTLDARQWQTIETKAKFIQQLRKGNLKDRTIEDISGEAANAAEMKAAASGNPLILEEMEARRKLKTLQNRATEHDREQHRIKSRIRRMGEEQSAIEERKDAQVKDAQASTDLDGKPFAAEFGGVAFDKHKEFGAAMIAAMRKAALDKSDVEATGRYGAFSISIRHQYDRAFIVAVEGGRTHEVWVEDAADQDATGLAQRVTNTVRKLRELPAQDAERAAEIVKQLPALEAQIGEWPQAQDLADTAARHRALVDRLKPQSKQQQQQGQVIEGNTAEGVDAPTANKTPDDPVSGTGGGLRSMEAPARPAGKSIKDFATDHIRAIGRQTKHEYIVAYDDDGSVVEYGTAGAAANTGMSNKLLSALNNPTRRLVVYHNHPSNRTLSPGDIGFLGYPGLYSVWALGHEGNDTRAALTPEAKRRVEEIGNTRQAVNELTSAMTFADSALRSHMIRAARAQNIDQATANHVHELATLRLLERANLIDIQTTQPYDTGRIEGLDALINDKAGELARAFYNDKQASIRRDDRQSQPLRHIAEVAGASDPTQPPAPGKPATGGFAEASPRGNPREDGRGESRVRSAAAYDAATLTQERAIEEIKGKLTDLQPALLKAIPLNYFTELAQSNMTAIADYMRVKRSMDAFRGDKHAQADEVAQKWLKYIRLGFAGKDKAKAQELAELMHDATLAGVDPADPTVEMLGAGGYDALKKRYDALPPKGKELYAQVRDAYLAQSLELDEILLDNVRKAQQIALDRAEKRYRKTLQEIRDVGLTGLDKKKAEEDAASAYKAETTKARYAGKARLTKMRIAFESSRVKAPYFPLARFGRYFATVRDQQGKVLSFSKFEKAADRDRTARELAKQFPKASIEVGVMEAGGDLRKAMDPRLVAEIEEMLGGAGVSAELMDQIWQRYLETMPDLSTRKRQIHRKGTAGYSEDALRAFSSHMFHAAHQMARLKYGLELQELVNVTMDQAKEADDTTKGVTLANELSSRHDWVMNPTGSSVAQTMTSAAFVWYLASSPASAMVNLTQTIMMGVPVLGARFGGVAKATAAIGKASRDSIYGKGSVTNANLTDDEQRAMGAFYASGMIDRTQSHDLAGVGDTGVRYSPLRSKIMGVISWAFHRAEVWNREVTALAAYRLARDNGAKWTDAVDIAHDLTWKTHFDYSNSSRPAILQNDFAKVALVFRSHNINMLYRVGRDIQQSLKGDTPQARREARYQLAGIVGMMTLMAGTTGTIGFNLIMAALGMAFGDDDDPMEFDERFKANVVEILGPELGGIALNGLPGHYLGVDLSSRIGMPDLWFRSPYKEMQGKDEFEYWIMQGLGASVGMLGSVYNGFSIMKDEGNIGRGLEMMAPKAVRDLMKAYRYSDEGLTSIRGDEYMSADEMGVHEILSQAMGFTPAVVAETWDRASALKGAEQKVRDKRQRLINRWAMAALSGDDEAMSEAVEGMMKFNAVPFHAGVQITKDTLQRSIKARLRNAARREDGVLIQNEQLNRALRDTMAPTVYK